MTAEDAPLQDTINAIDDAAGDGTVSLGTLLDSFEDRSLGVILAVFGLAVALPVIGGIPGMPAVGSLVVIIAVFHAFVGGQTHFWAPDIVRRQEVEASRVRSMLDHVRPAGRWIDNLLSRRLEWLVGSRTARSVLAVSAATLAGMMAVLAIVPGLGTPAALGIMALGLALMSRDGLAAAIGYLFALASAGALVWVVTNVL